MQNNMTATKFTQKILNRLIDLKKNIATEIRPSSANNLRKWVAVYPYKEDPVDKTEPKHLYSILEFELEISLIDTYFGENDKLNQKIYYVNSIEELYTTLSNLDISPSMFVEPWKCDYPL